MAASRSSQNGEVGVWGMAALQFLHGMAWHPVTPAMASSLGTCAGCGGMWRTRAVVTFSDLFFLLLLLQGGLIPYRCVHCAARCTIVISAHVVLCCDVCFVSACAMCWLWEVLGSRGEISVQYYIRMLSSATGPFLDDLQYMTKSHESNSKA